MPYGFTSPGANAGDAILKFLMQREMQNRQAMLDQAAGREREQNNAIQERSMKLQEQERADRIARQDKIDQTAAEAKATATRAEQNTIGVRGMMADAMTQGPLTPDAARTIGIMGFRENIAPPDEAKQMMEPEPEPTQFTLGEGDIRYDSEGNIVARGGKKTSATGERERTVAVQTIENGKRVTKYLPESQVSGQTFESPSGGPTLATGQARRILNFYNRMKEASDTINTAEPQIADQGLMEKAQGQYAPNIFQTPLQQSYRQAQRSFTEARLRKESGAAIPPHEYENDAITYFAQPGDSDATIAQKKAKREALLESTAFESGHAYEEFYGEPFQRSGGDDGWTTVNGKRVRRKPR